MYIAKADTYMHLTNYSIQKKGLDADKRKVDCDGKWMVESLKLYIIQKHGRSATEKLFADVQDLIVRSLLSVQQSIIQDKHSYELYGFDVLVDENLKPWLIEV